MKKTRCITLALALGVLSSGAALADDAVLGALIGGGAGAVVGHSVGGRDATIIGGAIGAAAGAAIGSQRGAGRVEYVAPPVYYAAPAYPQRVYYPPQTVYYARPVHIAPAPVYYVERGYGRAHHGHRDHRDWGRDDHRRARGWDDRR